MVRMSLMKIVWCVSLILHMVAMVAMVDVVAMGLKVGAADMARLAW